MHLKYTYCTWYLLIAMSSGENLVPIFRAIGVGLKFYLGRIYWTISWIFFQILWLSNVHISMRATPQGILEMLLWVMVHTVTFSLMWQPNQLVTFWEHNDISHHMSILYLFKLKWLSEIMSASVSVCSFSSLRNINTIGGKNIYISVFGLLRVMEFDVCVKRE